MGKKSTTTTSNEPWARSQPYLLGAADQLNNTFNANMGNIQAGANAVSGLLPDLIDKYKAGDSGINAARDYNTDVLSGRYLNEGNPYLEQVLASSNDDIRNQMQAALGVKGLTGGSNYADLISKNIAKNTLATRYGAYNDERSRMATAAGQSPSIAAGDAVQFSPIMQALQAGTVPLGAASQYAGSLGGLLGGYQTGRQTGSDGGAGAANLIGTALSAAALFSDERLKTDIRRVGATDEGLPVYTYRYNGEGPFHMGVMAQEVGAFQPAALGPTIGGYMTVRYSEVR